MSLFEPIISFDEITKDELNVCLVNWGHRMGPWNRPDYGNARFHGMRHDGRLVAVTATDQLITAEVSGLSREVAIELGRVCAEREHLNRVVLRLWREFVFPAICAARGCSWAISYQDAVIHSGNLYRFDGWVKLGESSSGADQRSGRKGRKKVIWGWQLPHAAAERRAA